ncbi:MAG: hypothetical protein ABI614_05340, partial [Planctomycetota bacterium]
ERSYFETSWKPKSWPRRCVGPPPQDSSGGMTLMHAIGLSLQNSDIVRVSSGGTVTADPSTAYDVDANDARILAALAAFDMSWEASFYGASSKQPPNAFFEPGLTPLPDECDTAAGRLGVNKRWLSAQPRPR